jgi:hypothetical protein
MVEAALISGRNSTEEIPRFKGKAPNERSAAEFRGRAHGTRAGGVLRRDIAAFVF